MSKPARIVVACGIALILGTVLDVLPALVSTGLGCALLWVLWDASQDDDE